MGSIFIQPGMEQLWVRDGNAANCNHGSTCGKGFLYIFFCFNAAAKVYFQVCVLGDRMQNGIVDNML